MDMDQLRDYVQRQKRAVIGALLAVAVLSVRHWVVAPHLTALHASQQYEYATTERIKKSKIFSNQLRARQVRFEELTAQWDTRTDRVPA